MAHPQIMQWAPPAIAGFVGEAHAALERHGPDHIAALAPRFRELFAQRTVLSELVNACLQRVLSGAMDNGDPAVNIDMLLMCYSPVMTLRAIKDRPDVPSFSAKPWRAALMNYPANTLILVVTPQPITVQWYCLDAGADFDVFDSTLRIRSDGSETVGNGDLIHVEARRRFPLLPERSDALYIALGSAPVNAQVVSFDPVTLAPLGASMASEDHSVLCVMLGLLDARRPDYPLAAVSDLTAHPDHHVRWAAATALGKHSRHAALQVVQDMAAHDRHKFVRDAALRTLQHCGGGR
jgi:HEAT repeats